MLCSRVNCRKSSESYTTSLYRVGSGVSGNWTSLCARLPSAPEIVEKLHGISEICKLAEVSGGVRYFRRSLASQHSNYIAFQSSCPRSTVSEATRYLCNKRQRSKGHFSFQIASRTFSVTWNVFVISTFSIFTSAVWGHKNFSFHRVCLNRRR